MSWPELPLTQCLEAWRGQAGRSLLPFSVLLGEKHRDLPGAPVVAIPSFHTKTPTPARQPSPLPTLPRSQGAG